MSLLIRKNRVLLLPRVPLLRAALISLRDLSIFFRAFRLHILRGKTKTCFARCLANEMSTGGTCWGYASADRKHSKMWIPIGESWRINDTQMFFLEILLNPINHIKSIKCTKMIKIYRFSCAKHGSRHVSAKKTMLHTSKVGTQSEAIVVFAADQQWHVWPDSCKLQQRWHWFVEPAHLKFEVWSKLFKVSKQDKV